uniref:tRNA-dihydrouridine20/20a synthase isoform X1 n=1 Tax=Rhizophora mucronata TaxID=61149 RepID=A0A2P2LEQ4_RHIMU
MVNLSRCSLISSYTPFHSIVLRKQHRFSLGACYKTTTKSRGQSAYLQAHQHQTKAEMVAKHYFPPLFSVAPMMDWTDNHYRTLARLISKHAWLYTEMVAAETIVYQEGNLVLKLKVPTFGSAFL